MVNNDYLINNYYYLNTIQCSHCIYNAHIHSLYAAAIIEIPNSERISLGYLSFHEPVKKTMNPAGEMFL